MCVMRREVSAKPGDALPEQLLAREFITEPMFCDVETSGELTYGATVLDRCQSCTDQPNMDVIFELDTPAVTDVLLRGLQQAN